MATRKREKVFASKVFAKYDRYFFKKNCNNCHIKDCLNCHRIVNNIPLKPDVYDCIKCHNGYHIGIEYIGLSKKDPSYRYKQGILYKGNYYLKMRQDIHYKKGLLCRNCHSMESLMRNKKSSKRCVDCHRVDKKIYAHKIEKHLQKLECYTCHSLWLSQEYGTYFIRNYNINKMFKYGLVDKLSKEYARSVYYTKRDKFPLAINKRGRISPVRPEFIVIYSDIKDKKIQNIVLSNTWKCVFPHTITKSAPICSHCHGSKWKFLQSCNSNKGPMSIFRTDIDFNRKINFGCFIGASILNGRFYNTSRVFNVKKQEPYIRGYLDTWNKILKGVR
ncbi:hypothetical protein JCM12298_25750 [Desulfothermus naphthae]